jgi:Flp pilus assembly pilin Flp
VTGTTEETRRWGGSGQEVVMTKSPVARLRNERGVTTAEYAVVTAAGCGFASVLIKLLMSSWGQQLLKQLFSILMKVVGL